MNNPTVPTIPAATAVPLPPIPPPPTNSAAAAAAGVRKQGDSGQQKAKKKAKKDRIADLTPVPFASVVRGVVTKLYDSLIEFLKKFALLLNKCILSIHFIVVFSFSLFLIQW